MTQARMHARNFFVELIRSWRELLIFVKPSELSMFGLLVLNKTFNIYRSALYQGWFVVVCIMCAYFEQSYYAFPVISMTAYALFMLLVSRSTVSLKTIWYLSSSTKTMLVLCALVILSLAQLVSVSIPGKELFALVGGLYTQLLILSPAIMLILLCLLDAHLTAQDMVRAIDRAIKIFLYHYPFFIIVYLCSWYLVYPLMLFTVSYAPLMVQNIGQWVYCMVLIPWYYAALVYGYTRFMREHMDYYY